MHSSNPNRSTWWQCSKICPLNSVDCVTLRFLQRESTSMQRIAFHAGLSLRLLSRSVELRLCRFFLQCESVMMVGCAWAVIFLKKLRNYRAMNTRTPQPVYPRTTCHWRTPFHTSGCLLELRMCAKLVSWVDPPDLDRSNTLPRPPTFTSDSWLGFLQVFTQGWHVGKKPTKVGATTNPRGSH